MAIITQVQTPTSTDVDNRLLDIHDVAALLATSVRHLRRLVHERRIPYHKVGGKLRFVPAEIHAWIGGSLVPARAGLGVQPPTRSG